MLGADRVQGQQLLLRDGGPGAVVGRVWGPLASRLEPVQDAAVFVELIRFYYYNKILKAG